MATGISEGTWTDYDPSWLVELARQQQPVLVSSLMSCTTALSEGKAYVRFVDPECPNQPGSEWQFDRNVSLHHPEHGQVVLDVLKDGRIGGLEFLDRLSRCPTSRCSRTWSSLTLGATPLNGSIVS
jgi:hypothetical protein